MANHVDRLWIRPSDWFIVKTPTDNWLPSAHRSSWFSVLHLVCFIHKTMFFTVSKAVLTKIPSKRSTLLYTIPTSKCHPGKLQPPRIDQALITSKEDVEDDETGYLDVGYSSSFISSHFVSSPFSLHLSSLTRMFCQCIGKHFTRLWTWRCRRYKL